jgi:hypothetical protein
MGKAAAFLEVIASQVTVLASPKQPEEQQPFQDDVPTSFQPPASAVATITDEDVPF